MGFFASAARAWLLRSFKPFNFKDDFDNELNYINVESLGLYVHIPFCRKICSFCPYCKQIYDKETASQYIDALLHEIELVCAKQKEKKDVTSLYFGGGSPALIADSMELIISKLRQYFNITDGIGVELHPDDINIEILNKIKSAGVTRISIGIQSFDINILRMLGREDFDCERIFNAINAVHFNTVAMDFIFAVEGQTFDSIKNDIDTAFNSGANHIALYPFIDFALADSNIRKMNNKKKKNLLYKISEYCKCQGYSRDSIWTFGKPGVDKYSSMTRDNFLGFGCSATTLLYDQFKINTFSTAAYQSRIKSDTLPTALTIRFTMRQRMVYWLFWRFYTTKLNPVDFINVFDIPLKKMYGFEMFIGTLLGLLKKTDGNYQLTDKGIFYYHYFERYYTYSYIDKMWNLMGKNPFPKGLSL